MDNRFCGHGKAVSALIFRGSFTVSISARTPTLDAGQIAPRLESSTFLDPVIFPDHLLGLLLFFSAFAAFSSGLTTGLCNVPSVGAGWAASTAGATDGVPTGAAGTGSGVASGFARGCGCRLNFLDLAAGFCRCFFSLSSAVCRAINSACVLASSCRNACCAASTTGVRIGAVAQAGTEVAAGSAAFISVAQVALYKYTLLAHLHLDTPGLAGAIRLLDLRSLPAWKRNLALFLVGAVDFAQIVEKLGFIASRSDYPQSDACGCRRPGVAPAALQEAHPVH